VPFDANDKVVVVTGLAPASEYEVVIEARYNHVDANIDDSNEKWVTARSAVSVFRTASNDTVWINPHRVTENDLTTLDFLSNHNSGTLDADVGFITMGGNSSHFFKLYVTFPSLPLPRYFPFPSLATLLSLPFPPFPRHCPFPSLPTSLPLLLPSPNLHVLLLLNAQSPRRSTH
jgi:hypothetical protein